MALDINGYNATFKAFTDFAQAKVDAGQNKAIARASADVQTGALAGRNITAASTDSLRGIFKWFRASGDQTANNATRTLFKNAIIDMFGGESKIPASVKKAMIMGDYDCGKPLTARRIMAVKAAIDADGTAKRLKLETFDSPEVKTAALNLGYTKGELPKLARAAHFYAQATGLSEMDAMHEVAQPGSKANRLMQYGGRFLESAQNFADGLRLVDSFATWFNDVIDTMTPIHQQERKTRDFSSANTLTKLNIDCTLLNKDNIKGIEKFVFEELASNPAHDLAGNDPEKLFGFKGNAAMRFVGRSYGDSVLSTIANIPPAKRAVIYAAYDLFTKQAQNAQEAFDQVQSGSEHRTQIESCNSAPFLARLLRNFDQLEAMHRKGSLTARNILNKFFPDIADKGNYDYKAINKYQADLTRLIYMEAEEGNPYADLSTGVLQNTMNNCGTTIEETAAALRAGKMPPIPKMLCTGSVELETFDGTTRGGRKVLSADADRPSNYAITGGEQDLLKSADTGFGFTFPDGTRLVTNGTHADNIPTVCNKIENLCGRVHAAQANSVMMMLSQSGLTNIRGGIPSLGVVCNEHSPVEFSLSKDEKTGDVTIKYSSPKELPFSFSWTATVDVDGNVTSTPLRLVTAEAKAATKEACTQFVNGQNIPEDRKAEYAKAIGDVLADSPDAADTLEVLRSGSVMRNILFNFANELRSAEDVAKRVASVRDNVAELREATGGNEAKFKAALDGLAEFGGKAIPRGVLTSVVKAAQDMDISALKKLNRSSKPLDIHKAVHAFRNGLEKIYADTGAIKRTYGDEFGAPEVNNFRTLASRLVLAGLDENARNNIHAAVNSRNGQLIKFAYLEVADGNCEWPEDYDVDKRDMIENVAFQFSAAQDTLSDFTLGTQNVNDGRNLRLSGVTVPGRDELDVDVTNLIDTARNDAEAEYAKLVNQPA